MGIDRRTFAKSLAAGALATYGRPWAHPTYAAAARARTPEALARAEARLPPAIVTKIRVMAPPNWNRNSPSAAFNQSNTVILVETDQGITGIGEGGTPDLINVLSQSVIGRNAFDIEFIWQRMYMDGFYSPGRERIGALGAIDMALWDIKGKALNVPIWMLIGGQVRQYLGCYATGGLPPGIPSGPTLKERAAATMAAGYHTFRVDGSIMPNPRRDGTLVQGRGGGGGGRGAAGAPGAPGAPPAGGPAGAPPAGGGGRGGGRGAGGPALGQIFDTRVMIIEIEKAAEQIREGVGDAGNWMIDVHQKFDFHEAVELCRRIEPFRPFIVEDPVREEQFRTQIPKLRMMTTVPLAPGEEWGQRSEFSTLVEQRDIDFARCTLPNVGGITEMVKIMAMCDTHKVGIVPHFTGPIATAGHVHTMTAFPGQVLMEFNASNGGKAVIPPYLNEFVEMRDGKVWPNDRPGLGITPNMAQLTQAAEYTQPGGGNTYRRPDGSPTHW